MIPSYNNCPSPTFHTSLSELPTYSILSFSYTTIPMQTLSTTLLYPFLFLLSLLLSFFLFFQWRQRQYCHHRGRLLPPGSVGWPYLGETLRLYTQSSITFFSSRQRWYGNIFKTHILGCPCVMISSAEAAKTLLVSQAHLFKPTFPPSKEMMIGPEAIFFQQGSYHSMLRKLVQSTLNPSAISGSVSEIEQIIFNFLPSWDKSTINTLEHMKRFTFDVAMLAAFGGDWDINKQRIKELYYCLQKGYNSMPLNLPWTPFRKAMKARTLLNVTMRKIIEKRRGSDDQGEGLLGVLLRSNDHSLNHLSDSQIADNLIGVIFAAQDTTASILTWILKYLHDNEDVLESVTEEQEGIQRRLIKQKRGLTWADTRKMPLTNRVIQETLRRASILAFTFREAVEDVEFEGYIIPKGWKVLPLFRSIHHSPEYFPHPENFDPSRFEVSPIPNTFLPFGNGVHSCPGSELAKLEILVFLHHLTTTYRWELVRKDDGVQYGPFLVPKKGLPIRVSVRTVNKEMNKEKKRE